MSVEFINKCHFFWKVNIPGLLFLLVLFVGLSYELVLLIYYYIMGHQLLLQAYNNLMLTGFASCMLSIGADYSKEFQKVFSSFQYHRNADYCFMAMSLNFCYSMYPMEKFYTGESNTSVATFAFSMMCSVYVVRSFCSHWLLSLHILASFDRLRVVV